MNTRTEDLIGRAIAFIPELMLRPNTGRLWQDSLFVMFIAAVQISIIPSILGRYAFIDLLTPWLVISCVRQRPLPATCLLIIAALSLETRSAAPRGLYLCPYWTMANLIIAVRPTFSWRHRVPWIATYVSATLFVVAFESFVYGFTSGFAELDSIYFLRQLMRVVIALGFGMLLARKWASIDADEPVPQ